jgi:hypothetical protein
MINLQILLSFNKKIIAVRFELAEVLNDFTINHVNFQHILKVT